MNVYSQDLRNKIIALYKTGHYSRVEIANMLSMCYATVCTWITQYEATGSCDIARPIREGRKRKFDNKSLVLAYINEHPNASGKRIRAALAPDVSTSSFYDSLKRMGIIYKKEVNYKQRWGGTKTSYICQTD